MYRTPIEIVDLSLFRKVLSREELEMVADLCKKWNVLCVSDEVYEWLVYPGSEHIRIGTYLAKLSVCAIEAVADGKLSFLQFEDVGSKFQSVVHN